MTSRTLKFEDNVLYSPPKVLASSQEEDEDLKLARTLQEQERAYFMLSQSLSGGSGGYFNETASGSVSPHATDRACSSEEYTDDEAFARALQQEEEREVMSRLIAAQMGLAGVGAEVESDSELFNSQDETDPDNMSYEYLTAIGELVGTQSRGVTEDVFGALGDTSFQSAKEGTDCCEEEQCVICRVEFESGENLKLLPCQHHYHEGCIRQWLIINKQCPMCSKEVTGC
eukprot:CAMPEP_0198198048 /NCGR_PEP_ID=MMETSP1445-20131203/1565_1 /TAXON_ID=36898 /ORGANISM="Pyramimonas sp., Strain CCMP2087" /LENGTH=228 /DNA_ID=CAMNT_0043867491 /DNA_START=76 /DNA_END=762 /DNA_ORIENTATION=+